MTVEALIEFLNEFDPDEVVEVGEAGIYIAASVLHVPRFEF